MTDHSIGTRKQWLAARRELLEAEKELTRRGDELARRRQELPWVSIDKEYRFETDNGSASLADLFQGRTQLLIYHFMFGPDYTAGCPACSAIADGFNGFAIHLANHDVMLGAVSRAPLEKLQDYKRRMGWNFSWASSFGDDFNFDFDASFTEEQQRAGIEYNYQLEEPMKVPENARIPSDTTPDGPTKFAKMSGTDVATYTRERPGMSAFVLEDGVVYHTYSSYSRGLDGLWGMYQWLDRAPEGRNETGVWWLRHDEYEGVPQNAGACCPLANMKTRHDIRLEITRFINAPRERVHAAWTDPALLKEWFGPENVETLNFTADVRVGGRYRWDLRNPDGEEMAAFGEYRELVPGRKIVFTWKWDDDENWNTRDSVVTVELAERDGSTEVRLIHVQLPSEESRDRHSEGWNGLLEKLEKFVGE